MSEFVQPQGLPLVDYPTLLVLAQAGEWRWHDQVLGFWRRHADSTTHARAGEIFEGCYAYAANVMSDGQKIHWEYMQVNRLVQLATLLAESGRSKDAQQALDRTKLFARGKRDRLAIPLASLLCKLGPNPRRAFDLLGRVIPKSATNDELVSLDTPIESINKY